MRKVGLVRVALLVPLVGGCIAEGTVAEADATPPAFDASPLDGSPPAPAGDGAATDASVSVDGFTSADAFTLPDGAPRDAFEPSADALEPSPDALPPDGPVPPPDAFVPEPPRECAPGCDRAAEVGNGVCNLECDNAACEEDGGDCRPAGPGECAPGCAYVQVGNGVCDPVCLTPACDFDADECEPPPLPCAPGCLPDEHVADGVCQAECNNEACAFDGGDCPPACVAPAAPADCTAARQGENTPRPQRILVTWRYDGPPPSGFRVARLDPGEDPANDAHWDGVSGDLPADARSFVDDPDQDGRRYSYRVRAFVDGACGRTFGPYSNREDAIP